MLPFDTEITADMQGETQQGETQQRVKRIAGLEQKPNALAPSPATSSSALADLRSVVAACWPRRRGRQTIPRLRAIGATVLVRRLYRGAGAARCPLDRDLALELGPTRTRTWI